MEVQKPKETEQLSKEKPFNLESTNVLADNPKLSNKNNRSIKQPVEQKEPKNQTIAASNPRNSGNP